jgi:phosphocarrier protein
MVNMVFEKNVSITNSTGLHARPAAQFVQKASSFESEINIIFEGKEVNAKSIMGVMSLGAGKGSEITLKADGDDSKDAIEDLVNFIEVEMPKEDE